jgi:hypothetical protein
MLDVDSYIQTEKIENEDRAGSFSFNNLAGHIVKRQRVDKDTIIAVCGDRGQGKSNWMLKIITAYIKLRRMDEPDFKWSWKKNFALTPSEAPKKAAELPSMSFEVMDEGGDIAYRGDANTIKTKNLVKFFNKSREKLHLTIWVIPDIFQINPKILNMCIMLVIVPYRYEDTCASAFYYGRSPNALTQDKFGLQRIKKYLESRKASPAINNGALDGIAKIERGGKKVDIPYPKHLFRFYKSLPGFKYSHWFGAADKSFEDRYKRHVKSKQLMAHDIEEKYVRRIFYEQNKKRYDTVLFNLHEKQGLSYQQIANLHLDENNQVLTSRDNIARRIGGVRARFEE